VSSGLGGGCECFMPTEELDDGPGPPQPPHLDACFEPSDWAGKSCDMLCMGGDSPFSSRCVEGGCPSVVVGYRVWDACYYDKPPEEIFPLDLGCSDIIDESLADEYHYISCCCEEYEMASDSSMESESG
jgi:hypothetical protein